AVRGVDGEAAEALSEVMARYGQGGAVIEHVLATSDSTGPVVQPLVVKSYIADVEGAEETVQKLREAIWHLNMIYPMPEPEVRKLAQSDWAEAWKQHYSRTKPGERLVVVPAWDEGPMGEGELPVRMDPGMAFGTGTHPSTQLCLLLLEKYLKPGDRIFDLGTGSGILSVAAARLGAGQIVASDTDPVAVQATLENIELNQLTGQIEVKVGSVDTFDGPFDLIVVNILAEVIALLLPDALARLAPGGLILLAGIIVEREDIVQEKVAALGLVVRERLNQSDWIGLAVERQGG
ncbi:MAG: 50S ribosomal protein L11 methyltransferase, partial [Ardenticatenales bacterium]|nr:50S ribosomal protein L11 methyltransferase [Ardenticatenales bacterium]